MIDVILIVVIVVLLMLVILQIIYIRTMFHKYDKEKYKLVNGITSPVNGDKNVVKTYGLNINKVDTELFNNIMATSSKTQTSIPGYAYVFCNNTPAYRNVLYNSFTLLVLNKNEGAQNLAEDVIAGRTRYIIIDNVAYNLGADREFVDKLYDALAEAGHDLQTRYDKVVIVLATLDKSFEFPDVNDMNECTKTSPTNIFKLQKTASTNTTALLDAIKKSDNDISLIALGFTTY